MSNLENVIRFMSRYSMTLLALVAITWNGWASEPTTAHYLPDSARMAFLHAISIPLVTIETVNQEEPTYEIAYPPAGASGISITNETKVPGRVVITLHNDTLYDSGEYIKDASGMTLKIRGNSSSAGVDKPSYKIKLQKKADLLCRGDKKYKDKEWNLSREHNLKCKEGFWVNELLGFPWTPGYEYVNLIINGYYRGWYMIVETVKRNEDCRINISKNGFIFESDAYWWNEDYYIPSNRLNLHYTFKYSGTEDLTPEQKDFMTNKVNVMEAQFWNFTDNLSSINIESFAAWMLGQDILGNADAGGSNMYFSLNDTAPDNQISSAMLWDFDAIENTPNKFSANHCNHLWAPLVHYHPSFMKAYVRKWKEVEPYIFDTLIHRIESYELSANAKAMDSTRMMGKWISPHPDTCSISVDVGRMKKWLTSRHNWLVQAIDSAYGYYDQPEITTSLPTAPLPADMYQKAFTPLGVRTSSQAKGLLIVVDENGQVHKILR